MEYFSKSGNTPAIRAAALRYLRVMSKEAAVAIAASALEDESEEVQLAALNVLAYVGAPEVEATVASFVKSSRTELKQTAWNTIFAILGRHNPEAAVELLSSTPAKDRGYFQHVLGDVLRRADSEAVRKLLKDEDESVRLSAIGRLCDELDVESLIPFTKSDSVQIRALVYPAIHKRAPDTIDLPTALESLKWQHCADPGYAWYLVDQTRRQAALCANNRRDNCLLIY